MVSLACLGGAGPVGFSQAPVGFLRERAMFARSFLLFRSALFCHAARGFFGLPQRALAFELPSLAFGLCRESPVASGFALVDEPALDVVEALAAVLQPALGFRERLVGQHCAGVDGALQTSPPVEE